MIQTYTPLPEPRTGRPVSDIAREIWNTMPHSGSAWIYCEVYIKALMRFKTWHDYCDGTRADEVGLRLLCNAGQWRGADARRLKDEIRKALRGGKA